MKLVLATRSAGKIREIEGLFPDTPVRLVTLLDLGIAESVEEKELEKAPSFAANALAKARHFHDRTGLPTLADDSGLRVDALGGKPVSDLIHVRGGGLLPWRTAVWLSRNHSEWGTTNKTHAVLAVEAFAKEYGHAALVRTFEWAAERAKVGEFSPKDRDELGSLMDLAGVPTRGAVA